MESVKKEWFESWFESDLYDLMYSHRDTEEAEHFLKQLLNYLQPPAHASFLDLACGTGRHAAYVGSQGFRTTGIDLSERKIELATARHQADHLEFFIHDMRKPFRINYYDYVLNLFTSFGYFDDLQDNYRVLNSVHYSLKPGGTFVMDYLNAQYVTDHLVPIEYRSYGKWKVRIKKTIENGRLIKDKHWTNGTITREYAEKVDLFTRDQLMDMMKTVGFETEACFGDYDLSDFDELNSPRVILVVK